METLKKINENIIEKEYWISYNGNEIHFQVICYFWAEYDPIDHEFGREHYYSIEHDNMQWMYFHEYTEEECYVIEQYFTENYDSIFLDLYNEYRTNLTF
jgi:hypothetical protein